MKVIKISEIEPQELKEKMFTGQVHLQPLVDEKMAEGFRLNVVIFSPGAKSQFHTHTNDQVIYVTEGKGIVATEDEEIVITPGMLVYIPPGEKHWHGATKDTSFAQIAITALPTKTEV